MSISKLLKAVEAQDREIERWLELSHDAGWSDTEKARVLIGWLGTERAKEMNDFISEGKDKRPVQENKS
jgi:hypothetical protein